MEFDFASLNLVKQNKEAETINDIIAQCNTLVGDNEENDLDEDLYLNVDYNKCDSCGNMMSVINSSEYRCQDCGYTKKVMGEFAGQSVSTIANYNTTDLSVIPFQLTGINSHQYQKRMISSTSDNVVIKERVACEQMKKMVYESENKLPSVVVGIASDWFCKMLKHHTALRADVRKGVIGNCFRYACIKEGISRKPKEFAKMCKISTAVLQSCKKIVLYHHTEGHITLPLNKYQHVDYLQTFLEELHLEEDKYLDFLIEIVERSLEKKVSFTSKFSSKAAGSIYILVRNLNLPISQETMERVTGTVHNTYVKYYNEVMGRKELFRDIFETHNVPLIVGRRRKTKQK